MRIINPLKMFFHKDIEETAEQESIVSKEDVLKELNLVKNNTENKVMENEKVEEIKNEELTDAPQVVSEEPEVQPEAEKAEEEPKTEELEEGIEPPAEEEAAGEAEGQEEPEVEEPKAEEEPQPEEVVEEQQSQPENEAESEQAVEEVAVEEEKVEEPKVEEVQAEEELPAVEQPQDVKIVEDSVKPIVKEVSNESELLKKIQALEAEKAEKELELQKMTLSKEVEKDYAGVPGKVEDKVDFIYEIQNSALSENAKQFILNSLQSLSAQNLKDCQEIGHEQEVEVDEKDNREKQIKNAMEKYDLTEGQAFLYVNGDKKLAEAKKASDRVRSKRK